MVKVIGVMLAVALGHQLKAEEIKITVGQQQFALEQDSSSLVLSTTEARKRLSVNECNRTAVTTFVQTIIHPVNEGPLTRSSSSRLNAYDIQVQYGESTLFYGYNTGAARSLRELSLNFTRLETVSRRLCTKVKP